MDKKPVKSFEETQVFRQMGGDQQAVDTKGLGTSLVVDTDTVLHLY